MGRVRIGTCSGLAESALVRAALEAHDIRVVINAEQHASMLGGIGGAFVPLHIYVDDEHAEEASALLADLRERGQHAAAEGADDEDAGAAGEAGDSEDADATGAAGEGVAGEDAGDVADVDLRIERRRRAGIVLLLGCFVPLGGIGHLVTGAWLRGLALVGLQVLAIRYLVVGADGLAVGLFAACKLIDTVGALWRIYTTRAAGLPVARMHLR